MSLRNNKGFSLIELMVVVAIIAILATIAVPSYQGFQAKARQKEGTGLLNSYYTAAQATYAELGGYPGNFVATGFSPAGQLGYRLIALHNNAVHMTIVFGSSDPACVTTAANCNACTIGACPNFMIWDEKAAGSAAIIGPAAPAMAAMNNGQTFSVSTAGWIRGGAANFDEYTLDERKNLTMVTDGTN